MDAAPEDLPNAGKTSMKTIFGKKKLKRMDLNGKSYLLTQSKSYKGKTESCGFAILH